VYGEDDAIAMRPYQTSLVCNLADSEVYILTRVEFFRMFKQSAECWKNAVASA